MYQREKKIKLLNTDLLITMDSYDHDVFLSGVLRHSKGDLKEIQKVIDVSKYVQDRGVFAGDMVKIDLSKYIKAVPKHKYDNARQRTLAPEGKEVDYFLQPDLVELGENVYIRADYSDIKYIVKEVEDIEDSGLLIPNTDIIV